MPDARIRPFSAHARSAVVPRDPRPTPTPIGTLAKHGEFEEFRRRAATMASLDLAYVFDRAVTDFRTVKRRPGHQRILKWCIENGLDPATRAGWMNQPVACLAAQYGNNPIVELMRTRGLPDNPFVRASIGDLDYLRRHAVHHRLV